MRVQSPKSKVQSLCEPVAALDVRDFGLWTLSIEHFLFCSFIMNNQTTSTTDGQVKGQSVTVDIKRVKPDPDQPRKHIDPAKLKELAASIEQHGVLQEIIVTELKDGAG